MEEEVHPNKGPICGTIKHPKRCMIGQFTKGRVYVFVDEANILYS
jgi:hypothetical protein